MHPDHTAASNPLGWSGGAKVLGKLSVPGCPTIWIRVGQGSTALAVGAGGGCRGVLLIWMIVGQGPSALAVCAGGGCLDIFSLVYHFSLLFPSLGDGPILPEILSQLIR